MARPPFFAKRSMPAKAPAEVWLATWLTSKTLAHWRVTADGASGMATGTARAEAVRVIAFHPEERRIASTPRSIESAKSLVIREGLSIERVRVVNRSRQDGLIYAMPVGCLESLIDDSSGSASYGVGHSVGHSLTAPDKPSIARIAPGLMLVDRLLARAGAAAPTQSGRPFAVLIDLCTRADQASTARLRRERLVIGVVLGDPSIQPTVVCSVTDEPVKDVARLVLYEQKLPDDAPWVLFDAADLLAAAPEVDAYPAEPEWQGVPTRRIVNATLAASVVLAVAGAGYAFDTLQRIRGADARANEARERIDRLQGEIGALMRSRPSALARELSLDPGAMLDRAGELWRAGARVSVETRGATADYTVSVPFSQVRMNFQNRPSAWSVTERARVAAVLAIEPPSGCTRSGLRATGALNEVSLVISCESPDSALARVLPR